MAVEKSERLAVLIDADNTQPSIIEGLLAEIAKYGTSNVKRIYGDWTSTALKGWKEVLLEFSIQPIQQFGYTRGKNATDSAMIIDAMDLLYTGRFNGFCIVSSDSDFTKLSVRIRESGLIVYGFGEKRRRRRLSLPATSLSIPRCCARKSMRMRPSSGNHLRSSSRIPVLCVC